MHSRRQGLSGGAIVKLLNISATEPFCSGQDHKASPRDPELSFQRFPLPRLSVVARSTRASRGTCAVYVDASRRGVLIANSFIGKSAPGFCLAGFAFVCIRQVRGLA